MEHEREREPGRSALRARGGMAPRLRRRRLVGAASLAAVLAFVVGLPALVGALSPTPAHELATVEGGAEEQEREASVDAVQAAAAGGPDAAGAAPDAVPRLVQPIADLDGAPWLEVPEASDVPGVPAGEVIGVLRAASGSADVADLRFLLARLLGRPGAPEAAAPRLVWAVLDGTAAAGDAAAVLALYDAVTGAPLTVRGRETVAVTPTSPQPAPPPAAAPMAPARASTAPSAPGGPASPPAEPVPPASSAPAPSPSPPASEPESATAGIAAPTTPPGGG